VDRQGYLAVSDLLNHRFCPRITWFAYVLGIKQRGTIKTEHGRDQHERWVGRERNRWREGARVQARHKLVSVEVVSESLLLRGRVDALLDEDGAPAPYEVKATAPPSTPWPGQVLQLAAYATLLEERFGRRVERAYLHYLAGDEVREQQIGDQEKRSVVEVLEDIQEVVTSEEMPPRAPPSHCRDCVYRKICV
jgi:CRISPR-associated exonuclease Cas4